MEDQLTEFISQKNFPCLMAKILTRTGHLEFTTMERLSRVETILPKFYDFVDDYRRKRSILHSFILGFRERYSFEDFERVFWNVLRELHHLDHERFSHDPRVSSDPASPEFCYSVKSEGFFILMMHPDSPRAARRTPFPAIVFNPHDQFESLRRNGMFFKMRNAIRARDEKYHGGPNPMLSDFGTSTEVLQYTGKNYHETGIDFYIRDFYAYHSASHRHGFDSQKRFTA